MPYICSMSYTVDIERSKYIRKMLKNKTMSLPLEVCQYFGEFNQEVKIRFVNCESTYYTSNPCITIEVIIDGTFDKMINLPDYPKGHRVVKKRTRYLTTTLRQTIKHHPKVKSFLKAYLSHFGIKQCYIETIKFKQNEVKS